MAQVLTNENMVEFIQSRTVPEFKPPEAPKAEGAPEAVVEKAEQPRGDGGKFVKQEEKPAEPAQATDAEPKGEQQSAEDDDDHSQLSEQVRKKIDKIIAKKHRAMKEAEEFGRDEARRAIAAEARAEALQREIEALRAPSKSKGSEPDEGSEKEPDPEDFKTVGEYTKALTKYEVRQAQKAEQAKRAKETENQSLTKAQERIAKQVEEARKEIPDYAEVLSGVDWKVPAHMQTFIVESDNGAKLAYHLAKDRGEFDRIAALSPARALAELGVMEHKLFSKAEVVKDEPPSKQGVSKAPPPIQPLEAKTTPVVKDPKDMTFAELRAHRESQKRDGKWRPY